MTHSDSLSRFKKAICVLLDITPEKRYKCRLMFRSKTKNLVRNDLVLTSSGDILLILEGGTDYDGDLFFAEYIENQICRPTVGDTVMFYGNVFGTGNRFK
jgi:hypothetical protein